MLRTRGSPGTRSGSEPRSRVTRARRARPAIRRTQGPSRSWGSGTGSPSERRKAKFSGRPTNAAPRAAACSTRLSAAARLRSTSVVEVICTTAARARALTSRAPCARVLSRRARGGRTGEAGGGSRAAAVGAGRARRRAAAAGFAARPARRSRGGSSEAQACRLGQAHSAKSGHTPQAGRRASQTLRPWKMTRSVVRVHRSRGTSAISCALDVDRVVALGEAQAVRHPQHVRVHRDALGDVEGVAEDDVRGLAADARQRDEGGHAPRHLAPVALDEAPREAGDAARLRPVEAGGADRSPRRRRAAPGPACRRRGSARRGGE